MAQIPSARLANAQSRRCGLMEASWRWGVLLIVLTMAIHAAAVVTRAFAGLSLRARLETRSLNLWNLIAIQICVIGVIGLLLAVPHGIECGIWAAAYLWLGALDSPTDALLYSVDAMSARGASGLTLQRPWQMMGAGGGQPDATVRDKYGVRVRGDAGALVNARQVCDLQPRLTRIDRQAAANGVCNCTKAQAIFRRRHQPRSPPLARLRL